MFCPLCQREFDDPDARVCPFDRTSLTNESPIASIRSQPTKALGTVYDKRYVVRGSLGEGGFGQIFLAEHAFTHQAVAIKVLNGREAKQPELRERFLREARTIDALEHPNIVDLLDAGVRRDGCPYLVMEYLHGETLGARLRRARSVPVPEALWIARQVTSALTAAHAAGAIHRDIKPDNIFLIGALDDPYTVKLVDFGLARLQGMSSLTAMGTTVGTIEYMAPEQAVKDPMGPRCDIYALGVVLYRMITGRLPFTGEDALLLAQHLIVSAPPLSRHVPDLDPRVEAVVMTALRKLPTNRYATMEDFQEDLERLLGQREDAITGGTVWEEDVYVPHSPYAKTVGTVLYKKLGLIAPWD
jgi:eukaryotic-like serine/threonine-protein kinase